MHINDKTKTKKNVIRFEFNICFETKRIETNITFYRNKVKMAWYISGPMRDFKAKSERFSLTIVTTFFGFYSYNYYNTFIWSTFYSGYFSMQIKSALYRQKDSQYSFLHPFFAFSQIICAIYLRLCVIFSRLINTARSIFVSFISNKVGY